MDTNFSNISSSGKFLPTNATKSTVSAVTNALVLRYAFYIGIIATFAVADYFVSYAIYKSPQLRNRSNILAASLIVTDAVYGVYATILFLVQAYVWFVEGKACMLVCCF